MTHKDDEKAAQEIADKWCAGNKSPDHYQRLVMKGISYVRTSAEWKVMAQVVNLANICIMNLHAEKFDEEKAKGDLEKYADALQELDRIRKEGESG